MIDACSNRRLPREIQKGNAGCRRGSKVQLIKVQVLEPDGLNATSPMTSHVTLGRLLELCIYWFPQWRMWMIVISTLGYLEKLNEIIPAKHLEQCLAHKSISFICSLFNMCQALSQGSRESRERSRRTLLPSWNEHSNRDNKQQTNSTCSMRRVIGQGKR